MDYKSTNESGTESDVSSVCNDKCLGNGFIDCGISESHDISLINDRNHNYMKSDFNANTMHSNDVLIYEMNCSESYDGYDSSYGTLRRNSAFEADITDYENQIKRLSADKCKLNDEIMTLEEQIMDVMSDKESAEKTFEKQISALKQRIESQIKCMDELRQTVVSLEVTNEQLEQKVNQKVKENHELAKHLGDIEDKLIYTEYQLSEANKTETHLRHALNVTEKTLSADNGWKSETIERLNQLSMYCTDRDKHIYELNLQMDSLKQEISDRDNELWFFRS